MALGGMAARPDPCCMTSPELTLLPMPVSVHPWYLMRDAGEQLQDSRYYHALWKAKGRVK